MQACGVDIGGESRGATLSTAEQIPSFRRGNSDDFDFSNAGLVCNPQPPLGSHHVAPGGG